jgi:hypothetical protein
VLKLTATLLSAGLLATAAPGMPFVHGFSAGETIRYRYALDVAAMSDLTHYRGTTVLEVKTLEPDVTGTEHRTMETPAQNLTRAFHLRPNGVLAFEGGKEAANNYVTYDSRRYCPLPASVTVGMTWTCATQTAGLYAGGDARVRLVSMAGSEATLEIDGTGAKPPRVEHDPDTGKSFTSRQTVSWHDVVHFKDGLVQSSVREQLTKTVVENAVLQLRVTAKYDRL